MKIMGSEVSHTLGSDLISLSFCFLLGQMGTLMTLITLGCTGNKRYHAYMHHLPVHLDTAPGMEQALENLYARL